VKNSCEGFDDCTNSAFVCWFSKFVGWYGLCEFCLYLTLNNDFIEEK